MEPLIDLSTPRPVRPADIFTPGLAASLNDAFGARTTRERKMESIKEAGDENDTVGWTKIFAKPTITMGEAALVPEPYGGARTPRAHKQKRPPSTPLTPSLMNTKVTKRRALSERCSNTPSPRKSIIKPVSVAQPIKAQSLPEEEPTTTTTKGTIPKDALDDDQLDAAIDAWLLRERLADLESLVEFMAWERQFGA